MQFAHWYDYRQSRKHPITNHTSKQILNPSNETRLIQSWSLHTLHPPSLTLLTVQHERDACTHVLVRQLVESIGILRGFMCSCLGSLLKFNLGLFLPPRFLLLVEEFALARVVIANTSYTIHPPISLDRSRLRDVNRVPTWVCSQGCADSATMSARPQR